MQSSVRLVAALVLLTSALASAYHNSAKLRRDGVLNLYPFPRVGRANRHTWQVPHNEMYLDYEPIEKRQLYAFPRVGRSDLSLLREPVAEPLHVRRSDTNGMWFGPRVGRSFKSEDDDITFQNESSDRSEPELMEPVHEEREKRHTKQN
ncbi:CAPA peptides-like [Galleria mellonella]|uniref:CAPA n=1 Tax=Galleria mellonella TaxID=7137 RepID=A0A6J1WKE9_GALME|nr:CAPA peptides-like [Galleria mellonella]WLY76819.1 CAPA [Galleria mellonella]